MLICKLEARFSGQQSVTQAPSPGLHKPREVHGWKIRALLKLSETQLMHHEPATSQAGQSLAGVALTDQSGVEGALGIIVFILN